MNTKKTWFISGANNELGISLVKQLLQLGHNVAATSPNIYDLIQTIGDDHPAFLPLQLDTASDSAVAQVLKSVNEVFGRIDVVVNNGSYSTNRSVSLQLRKETNRHFEKNVFGTLHVIRRAMPYLQAQQSGHIINIVSDEGVNAAIGWAPDAAAKHAVMGFSEVLYKDAGAFGAHVTVVTPGSFCHASVPESLIISKRPLEAYDAVKSSHVKYLQASALQATSTCRVAMGIIDVAEEDNPPLYLVVGNSSGKEVKAVKWQSEAAYAAKFFYTPADYGALIGSN
ncbi:NADP-dependent 3-hydroxy acid dehydrogenase YdfG [Filimonas lacunae]|uniref:NADP-dependent 3-hydroxy acid dehydrogenase YdfG n=1 Tax=Filimonas lacunae TaxID=477680 RepID=A0A173MQI0_9BACT|nr:SDR family NAD(P)-dependent oxidoreductase [Filimonas lacunae]BAV09935.1 short chain dehydrogenase [Filimonas lacunae]SIS81343.1 NADP-dependent 3-hydroxy acid dehydrogenase YdfG [Filimonas lacunae]